MMDIELPSDQAKHRDWQRCVIRLSMHAVCAFVTLTGASSLSAHPATGDLTWLHDQQVIDQAVQLRSMLESSHGRHACNVLPLANRIQEAVGGIAQSQFEAAMGSSASGTALDHLERRLMLLQQSMPVLGLSLGAETVYHYIRYDKIDPGPQGAGAPALKAASHIWPEPSGRPVFLMQRTDVQACTDPAALLPALADLRKAWPATPDCLKIFLQPQVQAAVAQLQTFPIRCGAGDFASTLRQVDRLAAELH